jgi:hypothetical protein
MVPASGSSQYASPLLGRAVPVAGCPLTIGTVLPCVRLVGVVICVTHPMDLNFRGRSGCPLLDRDRPFLLVIRAGISDKTCPKLAFSAPTYPTNVEKTVRISTFHFSAPSRNDTPHSPRSPMTRGTTEFRERVQEKYNQAMAQIDPIVDRAIMLTRNWIGGPEDPGSLTEIRKALEAAVLIYTANCGPLDTSNAAWLMLKAITHTLREEQHSATARS